MQKDEPQAPNRPTGAFIDYYLKAAPSTPVTLEIVDAAGTVVKTFSSAAAATSQQGRRGGGAPGISRVSPLWITAPDVFSASPGLHRAIWNPVVERPATPGVDGSPGGGGELLTGTFTARLTVGGRSYTQTFEVKPDPRVKV